MYGRADINVVDAMDLNLEVHPHPVIGNPNHANVVGWPPDKPAQKIIAMELATAAIFVKHPRLAEVDSLPSLRVFTEQNKNRIHR